MPQDSGRNLRLDAVPPDDIQSLAKCRLVRRKGTRGDDVHAISENIGNQNGAHGCAVKRLCKPPSADAADVFSHGIHLADVRSAGKQCAGRPAKILKREPFARSACEGACAARHERKNEIAGPNAPEILQQRFAGADRAAVRHGVGSLEKPDFPERQSVPVLHDRDAARKTLAQNPFGAAGHGRGSFPKRNDMHRARRDEPLARNRDRCAFSLEHAIEHGVRHHRLHPGCKELAQEGSCILCR